MVVSARAAWDDWTAGHTYLRERFARSREDYSTSFRLSKLQRDSKVIYCLELKGLQATKPRAENMSFLTMPGSAGSSTTRQSGVANRLRFAIFMPKPIAGG